MGFLFGLLLGFFIGAIYAVWCTCKAEKKAASDGFIKLDGEIYRIEKVQW